MRTPFSRAGVLALVVALLAACGSGESSDDGGGADPGSPQAGGSLRAVLLFEPRTLDPAILGTYVTLGALVGNSLYGQLLRVDEAGEVEYGLAESLSTSDGGTTWELVLREELTFSDGSPLDAAAVAANWERVADPAVGSRSQGYAALVDTMTPSGRTLGFTLTRPVAQFHQTVSAEAMNWIASPQALEAGPAEFDAEPIGAGPFVLDSWQRGGELVLTRNDGYYDSPLPYLDELVLTVNGDGGQRFAALESGGADAVVSSNPDLLAVAVDGGQQAARQDLGDSLVQVMNARIAPFDDVRARRAVALGVDREAVNAAAYQGEADVPETLFADDSPYNGDATLPEYDPEAAQELFDELADEGKPVSFTLTSPQSTQERRVAEAIQAQLDQYDGVSVELEVLEQTASYAKFSQRTFQMTTNVLRTGDVDIFTNLYSDLASNVAGITDPELDAALEDGLTATDEEARNAAFQRVAELYGELVPNLHYIRTQWALAHSDRLHGVEMYGTSSVRTDTLWLSD